MKKVFFRYLLLLFFISFSDRLDAQSGNVVGDEPWNAIVLSELNQCVEITIDPSIYTISTAVEAPGCAGNTVTSENPDVWLLVTVPENGNLYVSPPNVYSSDPGLAVYRFDPSTTEYLLLGCDDDTGPGLMPRIDLTGLIPGEFLYLRYWLYHSYDIGSVLSCGSGCNTASLYFSDNDSDGYGNTNQSGFLLCQPSIGFVSNSFDCDDQDSSIFPGSIEICSNGIDEDCTGSDSICLVLGCLDTAACNYNANATEDNASCIYPSQTYLNCDGSCINDTDADGVCNEIEVPGCTDPTACNYNASATDNNASCIYPSQTYLNCDGSCINDTDADGVCNEIEVVGCTDVVACNYNASATDDNASCNYPSQTYLNCDGSCINDTDADGVCNEIELLGCTDPLACNYNASATDDNASCNYPSQTYLNCDGSCINDTDADGVCNEIEVPGCTDPTACNYNATATDVNASCIYPSQTYLNCDGSCVNDMDGDGVCDEIEISGCTDSTAFNFNPQATNDDGSCVALLTCNITAPTTTLCAGESVNLSISSAGGAGTSSQLPANLQQGLVAYYPFNGNANDESGNGNNGVAGSQQLSDDRFGDNNSAYQFYRDYSKIVVNNSILGVTPQSFSISLWMNADMLTDLTDSQGNAGADIVCDRPISGWYYKYRFMYDQNSNGGGAIRFASLSSSSISGLGYYFSNSIANQWYNVVVTSDILNNVNRMYINGSLVDENYEPIVYPMQNTPTTIGGNVYQGNANGDPSFKGKIDDLGFWNRALSPSEIQQLYSSQSYAWNTGATTNSITVTPTANTTYSCTVTQGSQNCTASIDITVNPTVTNDISATIIEGETYTLGTQTLTTAGTYTEVFTSDTGCDSTVTLTLAVEPLLTCNITAATTTLCAGESVNLSISSAGGAGSSSQLPANLQQGLVAYYPFNGNANDESGNGNNGTVNGATLTSDRFGNANGAYVYNGVSNNIQVPHSESLNIFNSNQESTISFWVNRSVDSPGEIISKGWHRDQNDCPGYIGNQYLTVGYYNFSSQNGFNYMLYNSQIEQLTRSSSYNEINSWNHVLIIRDSNARVYVNGILDVVESNNLGWSIDYNNSVQGSPLTFGARNNFSNNCSSYLNYYFNGLIDDIVIYNRALSPSEIQQLYTAQSYAWNTGVTTNSITVTPTTNTTYSCTVTSGSQTCTASVDITVTPQQNFYADADGDGFGNPNAPQSACEQPVGFVSNANDCNDNEALAFVGATDICDNGIDEDCSGADSTCIVLGCTDVAALNFNPAANTDDGSCIAVVLGCTDVSAFNYNAAANTDDGSCIPVVVGCTNSSACNFNELANTDDDSCILPQTETCNGLDDNCDGQVDEGLTLGSVSATSVTTALYPTCSGNALKSANLNNGANSPIIDGNGLDLWYSMTAQYNTLRAGLSAAFGDNEIRLYSYNNGCFELMETEHEVYTASTAATGNQVLISDDLLVGQTYYISVHNISGPMNSSAKMCFNHFVGSTCDHYYSNYTGVYNNVCTSFKAQYKGNATNYIFDILSATQNNANLNITPWSYTTTTANSVVPRLGTIFPVNMSNAAKVYTLRIPVIYAIPDAAGNYTSITANATTTCTVTLNAELPIALRAADRCPNTKTTTSSISVDRTICGAQRYEWEFTQQLPSVQSPVTVLGGLNTTVFFLNNVPGMGTGKTYNVRVRPIHANGEVGNWGTTQCLKTGTAGMVMQSESGVWANNYSPRQAVTLYPNPTSTGHFTLMTSSTEEEVKQIVITDITGKMVFQSQVVMNGNVVEVEFGDLATGMYLVMVGEERIRLIVE